jgi:hypothetical protein
MTFVFSCNRLLEMLEGARAPALSRGGNGGAFRPMTQTRDRSRGRLAAPRGNRRSANRAMNHRIRQGGSHGPHPTSVCRDFENPACGSLFRYRARRASRDNVEF